MQSEKPVVLVKGSLVEIDGLQYRVAEGKVFIEGPHLDCVLYLLEEEDQWIR